MPCSVYNEDSVIYLCKSTTFELEKEERNNSSHLTKPTNERVIINGKKGQKKLFRC